VGKGPGGEKVKRDEKQLCCGEKLISVIVMKARGGEKVLNGPRKQGVPQDFSWTDRTPRGESSSINPNIEQVRVCDKANVRPLLEKELKKTRGILIRGRKKERRS